MGKTEITKDRKGRPHFPSKPRSPSDRLPIEISDVALNQLASKISGDNFNEKLSKLDGLLKFYKVKSLAVLAYLLAQDFVKGFDTPPSIKPQGRPRNTLRDPQHVAGMVLVAKTLHPDYTDQEACELVACIEHPTWRSAAHKTRRENLARQLANLLPKGRKLLEAEAHRIAAAKPPI